MSSSLNFGASIKNKEMFESNNTFIIKCGYQGENPLLKGVSEKFTLRNSFIPDYAWITPKSIAELSQL